MAVANEISQSSLVGEWADAYQENVPEAVDAIVIQLWNEWDQHEHDLAEFLVVAQKWLHSYSISKSYVDTILNGLEEKYETNELAS